MASEEGKKAELDRRKNTTRTANNSIGGRAEPSRNMPTSGTASRAAALVGLPTQARLAYVQNQNRGRTISQNPAKKIAKKAVKNLLRSIVLSVLVFLLPWIMIAGSIFLIVVLLGGALGIW